MCGCGSAGAALRCSISRIVLQVSDARTAPHSRQISSLTRVRSCAQVWSHLPPFPLCSEGESIPPLRNDHKSALVSLAVNKSAFYWRLFIILHFSVHWGWCWGRGRLETWTGWPWRSFLFPYSLSAAAAFDGESLSPPSAQLLSDLLSLRLLLSIREPCCQNAARSFRLSSCPVFLCSPPNPATWLSDTVSPSRYSHHRLGLVRTTCVAPILQFLAFICWTSMSSLHKISIIKHAGCFFSLSFAHPHLNDQWSVVTPAAVKGRTCVCQCHPGVLTAWLPKINGVWKWKLKRGTQQR